MYIIKDIIFYHTGVKMEQLITALSATRKNFVMESFIGTDNIFALVESGSFFMESSDGA